MFDFLRRRRRRRLQSRSFPDEWQGYLYRMWPLYRGLPEHERRQLHSLIHVFLDEKTFEGCNGFAITDHVRLLIAAHACLLLINREVDCYRGLHTILVYPNEFLAPVREEDGHVVTEDRRPRSGEAWGRGTIIVSWEDVAIGREGGPAYDVLLHEFAHALDQETGEANGAPFLENRTAYADWSRVMTDAYRRHRRESLEGFPAVLDPYGAQSPAEFFAVATESFFDTPNALRRDYPELYNQLRLYYRQDPVDYYPDGACVQV